MIFYIGTGDRIRTHTRSFGRCYPGFEDRCATVTPRRCLRLSPISSGFSLFIFIFSFKWNPTLIIATLNRIILFYSILFSFIKFINAAILDNVSAKAFTRYPSVILKKFVWMLSSLERGSVLVSSFIHVLTLSNINLSILVVSYLIYSTWRTSHKFLLGANFNRGSWNNYLLSFTNTIHVCSFLEKPRVLLPFIIAWANVSLRPWSNAALRTDLYSPNNLPVSYS